MKITMEVIIIRCFPFVFKFASFLFLVGSVGENVILRLLSFFLRGGGDG